jgi:hypothetical protein
MEVMEWQKFPLPVDTGILHIPEQELTWPMVIPQGGLSLVLDPALEERLTYGMVTGIVASEHGFSLLGRVDYAYAGQEDVALFRLEWALHREFLESVAECGILVLGGERPPASATKEEMADFLTRVTTFVCEFDPLELHRLRIQVIRMKAQEQLAGRGEG